MAAKSSLNLNNVPIPAINCEFDAGMADDFAPTGPLADYALEADFEAIEYTLRYMSRHNPATNIDRLTIGMALYSGGLVIQRAEDNSIVNVGASTGMTTFFKYNDPNKTQRAALIKIGLFQPKTDLPPNYDPARFDQDPIMMALVSDEERHLTLIHELQHIADKSNLKVIKKEAKYYSRAGLEDENSDGTAMMQSGGQAAYDNSPMERRARIAEKNAAMFPRMIYFVDRSQLWTI